MADSIDVQVNYYAIITKGKSKITIESTDNDELVRLVKWVDKIER